MISYAPVAVRIGSTEQLHDNIEKSIHFCNETLSTRKLVEQLIILSSSKVPGNYTVQCKGQQWTVGKCTSTSNPYICVNCLNYCNNEATTPLPPNVVTCANDVTKASDYMRLLIIEFNDLSVPPAIKSLSTTTSGSTNIRLSFEVDVGDGTIVCGAYLPTENAPKTVNEINFRGAIQSIKTTRGNYTISGLVPSTTYHTYCGTMSNLNVPSRQLRILETKRIQKSACCRQINVDIRVPTQLDSQDVANVVLVSLADSFLPEKDISLSLIAKNISGQSYGNMFTPQTVQFTSTSKSRSYFLSYRKVPVGVYMLEAALAGESAEEYSVKFVQGNAITVLSSTEEPITPLLTSAIFANDGSSVTISFNSPTNRGMFVNFFACSSLFSSAVLSAARCQWVSDTSINVIATESSISIGEPISLKANSVKAKCIASALACLKWKSSSSSSVIVAAPPVPTIPIINIVAPALIGPCSSLLLDLTGSLGGGGRPFKTLSISVSSADIDIAPLRQFLENITTIQYPITITSTLVHSGFAYNFQIYICNFLGACATKSHRLIVSNSDSIPIVSISAQRLMGMQRNSALRVTGNAYVPTCDGQQSRENMEFEWSISRDQLPLVLPSISPDPTVFRLPPYSLEVGGLYQVTLTARHLLSLKKASTSVSVSILVGKLIAKIAGPSSRGLRVSDSLRLDASISYDEDKNGDIEHLLFSFQCMQVSPDILTMCPLEITAVSDRVVQLSVPSGLSLVDTIHEITLFVSSADDPRTAKTSVTVTILPSVAPVITLYTEGNPRINPSDKLKLVADVLISSSALVSWEVDDTSVPLQAISLSDTSKYLTVAEPVNGTISMTQFRVSLVLPAFSLSEQSSFTFTLFCSYLSSASSASASVVVTTNSPPYPGKYVVSPTFGVQLETEFMCQAIQWEDSDLPLAYEFSYENPANGEYMVHRARMEITFVFSKLPAGLRQANYTLNTRVHVFDALSAVRMQQFAVTVKEGRELSLQSLDDYFRLSVVNASGFAGIHCSCEF